MINIIGDISEESFATFVTQVEDARDRDIKINLSSAGGDAMTSLAYYDYMKNSSKRFTITVYGQAQSAAVLLLAAADEVHMAENAWVMVHQSSDELSGEVHEIAREASHMQRLEDQCNALLALNSNASSVDWAEMHRKTTYLSARECLELGLIDKVVTNEKT